MDHRLFDDAHKGPSAKSAELLGDLLQTETSIASSPSSYSQHTDSSAEEDVHDDESPFRANSDVVFDNALILEKMQKLTADVRPFKSKSKVDRNDNTSVDDVAPSGNEEAGETGIGRKENKRASWGILSSRGKDEVKEMEAGASEAILSRKSPESLREDEGIDVGPLDEELRISKAECSKYKQLYEAAMQKIDVLEDKIQRLEFKLSMKETNQAEASSVELELNAADEDDVTSINKLSKPDIDPEWLRLQEEERARKAKIKAKKLADARKKKGGKRATSRQQQRQQQELKNNFVALKAKASSSLDNVTMSSTLEQQLPDVPTVANNAELTKASSTDKGLWDEDDEEEDIVLSKELPKQQTRRESVDVDWDSSDDDIDESRGNNCHNEDDWSSDNDDNADGEHDNGWSDDDWNDDEEVDNDNLRSTSATNTCKAMSLPSESGNSSINCGADYPSKSASLEAAIENSIMSWARGKNIVDLLNSVRTVYHGYVGELGNEWIIGYANLTLTPSQIRKAYMSTVRYCHPDKQQSDATELIKLQAKKVFSVLSEAYNIYKESV